MKWDGTNIWPVLAGGTSISPRALYWVGSNARSSAVRLGDWKLMTFIDRDPHGKRVELYNLAKDPREKNNLAASETERVTQLEDVLSRIAQSDRDAEVTE